MHPQPSSVATKLSSRRIPPIPVLPQQDSIENTIPTTSFQKGVHYQKAYRGMAFFLGTFPGKANLPWQTFIFTMALAISIAHL